MVIYSKPTATGGDKMNTLQAAQQAYDNMVEPCDDLPDTHSYTGEIHLEIMDVRFDFEDGKVTNVCECDGDGELVYDGPFESWGSPLKNQMLEVAEALAYDQWLDDIREGKYDDY